MTPLWVWVMMGYFPIIFVVSVLVYLFIWKEKKDEED